MIDDSHFSVNGKVITVVSSRDPTQLPWKALDVDLVIEGTGVFIDTKGATKHLEAGAKKVGGVGGRGWGGGAGGAWQVTMRHLGMEAGAEKVVGGGVAGSSNHKRTWRHMKWSVSWGCTPLAHTTTTIAPPPRRC